MQTDRNKIAVDIFNKCATEYQLKYMNVDLYKPSLNLFCDSIKKENPEILELACGPGNITRYLLERRPDFKILGTDSAPNMVELAAINNPEAEFKQMDCRDIYFLEKKCDGIICGFGLPYLSKEEAVKLISDAALLLNDRGVIYLSTMKDDYEKSRVVKSSSGEYELYMYFHQEDYLAGALKGNGLKIIDIQHQDYSTQDETKITDLIIIAGKNLL